ncbi:hypothetical protein [Streptomyces sp. NPDC093105]|uniref:hypothetical protein n=1 Tax=Streptomyces sp. NPDC093105 TaxID=3366029 RepID=UPI00381BFB29
MTRAASRHGKPYDPRRRRLQNAIVGLAGLVVLLVGVVLLIGVLPTVAAEERAFLAASACRGPETRNCLQTASFTVESVALQRGKSESGRVRVVSPQGGDAHLQFNAIGPFLERVRSGDRVRGTLWRGRIVVLADAEGGQRTAAHPVGDPLFCAAFGITLVLSGGLGTYAAWWWIRHPESIARRHPAALVRAAWTATLLGVYAFGLMTVLYKRGLGLSAFLALWTPGCCAAVVFLLWPRRATRGTLHVARGHGDVA